MRNAGEPRRGRRRWLSTVGTGLAGLALAGCLDGGRIGYESGTVPEVDGSNRSAQQQVAAESLAKTSTAEGTSPLDALSLTTHEFVYEDDYKGSTVQGIVTNTGEDRVELAEVRVRVYDENDAQLGQYVDRTGDLGGNSQWSFTVIILENPADLARYEIAVVGTPG